MRYTLLFDRWELGSVETVDADFPTFYGTYRLSPELRERPELAHLLAYHDFSVRTWPLIEENRPDDISYEEEEQYTDLIESDAWYLREPSGKLIPILIPVFCAAGWLNWRLNPEAEAAEP